MVVIKNDIFKITLTLDSGALDNALTLITCVTLRKLLIISDSVSLICKIKFKNISYSCYKDQMK